MTISAPDPTDQSHAEQRPHERLGPFLYMRGLHEGRVAMSALVVRPAFADAPILLTDCAKVSGEAIWECDGLCVYRYAFSLKMVPDAWYELEGSRYEVNAAFDDDLRIAFVACNGQESGDRNRPLDERNVLWQRLARQHREQPFQLLLHGGDQIYADELTDSHPLARQWAESTEVRPPAPGEEEPDLSEVAETLRRAFFGRYLEVLGQPSMSWLMARIPSLAIWDDHDICDGWGSLRPSKLDAPVGKCLFSVARDHFMIFQLGERPDRPPCICPDSTGTSLTWHVRLPQLHIVAPDLRSERRPQRVMGERGWKALESALDAVECGRVLFLSSVPALGPRLSWVEAVMHLTSRLEKYEDDLRDQWQSRAHRAEWRTFLEGLARVHAAGNTPVTVISGEIHLATRGTLDVPPAPIHQLVASGITHPAPPAAYAWALGALAHFGESPLPGHPVKLHPLPGKTAIYTAQRNYLVLERQDGRWRVWWELEENGATPAMAL